MHSLSGTVRLHGHCGRRSECGPRTVLRRCFHSATTVGSVLQPMRCPVAARFKVCNYCGAKIVPPYEEEKARVELRQEVQAPKPPAPQKGITWWVIPLSLFLLFVILPLISYSIFSPSSSSPSSSPSSSRAVPRLVPDVQMFNTGNRANDMILALPESNQSYGLGVIVNSAAYSCVGQRTFYMGISRKDQFAYWSIGCTNGQSYQVEFAPNAGGSTKVPGLPDSTGSR